MVPIETMLPNFSTAAFYGYNVQSMMKRFFDHLKPVYNLHHPERIIKN